MKNSYLTIIRRKNIYRKSILILSIVFLLSVLYLFVSNLAGTGSDNFLLSIRIGGFEIYPDWIQALSGAIFITSIVNLFLMINTYYKVREKNIGVGVLIAVVLLFLALIGLSIILLIPFYVFSIIQYLKMKKMKIELIANDNISQLIMGIKENRKKEIKHYVKKYKLFKFSFNFVFFAVCSGFIIYSAWLGFSGILFTIDIVLIIIMLIIHKVLEQLIHKRMDTYSEKCDPELFLGIYSELEFSEASELRILYFKLNQCQALYGMGEFEETKNRLLNMDIDKLKPLFHVFHYYNLLFKSYLELGDIENLFQVKQQFELLKTDKKYQIYTLSISQYLRIFDTFTAFAEKEYQKAIVLFDDLLKNAESLAQKVTYSYYSALIDLEVGKLDSAKEKLKYAVENGNNLFFSCQAKEKLKLYSEKT